MRRARQLSLFYLTSDENFTYVMEEFAETVEELGELASLGARYQSEVLDENPGFY